MVETTTWWIDDGKEDVIKDIEWVSESYLSLKNLPYCQGMQLV